MPVRKNTICMYAGMIAWHISMILVKAFKYIYCNKRTQTNTYACTWGDRCFHHSVSIILNKKERESVFHLLVLTWIWPSAPLPLSLSCCLGRYRLAHDGGYAGTVPRSVCQARDLIAVGKDMPVQSWRDTQRPYEIMFELDQSSGLRRSWWTGSMSARPTLVPLLENDMPDHIMDFDKVEEKDRDAEFAGEE